MIPEVRDKLKEAIKTQLDFHGKTWKSIQEVDIKTEWGCPFGWSTLRKYANNDDYHPTPSNQVKLLNYYLIKSEVEHGIVKLKK